MRLLVALALAGAARANYGELLPPPAAGGMVPPNAAIVADEDDDSAPCQEVGVFRWPKNPDKLLTKVHASPYDCWMACHMRPCRWWSFREEETHKSCILVHQDQKEELRTNIGEAMVKGWKFFASGPKNCPGEIDEGLKHGATRKYYAAVEADILMSPPALVSATVAAVELYIFQVTGAGGGGDMAGEAALIGSTPVKEFFDDNPYKLIVTGSAQVQTKYFPADFTFGPHGENLSNNLKALYCNDCTKAEFEAKIQFQRLSSFEATAAARAQAVQDMEARVAAAQEAQQAAKNLLEAEKSDAKFEQNWTNIKATYGFKDDEFGIAPVEGKTKFASAMAAMSDFESTVTSKLMDAKAFAALPANPFERTFQLVKLSHLYGINFTEISQPYAKQASDTFSNEYYSETMRKNLDQNMYSTNSITAGSITAKGGMITSFGAVGGSMDASGKFQWNSQLDSATLTQNELTEVSVSKRHVSQIFSFVIRDLALDEDTILLDAIRLGMSARCRLDPNVRKHTDDRANDFLNTYPLSVFMGPYGVGGWFEVSATTRSDFGLNGHTLVDLAGKKADASFSLGASMMSLAGLGSAGLALSHENESMTVKRQNGQDQHVTITTSIESKTRGPPVTNANDMQNLLRMLPDTWVIFPEIGAQAQYRWQSVTDLIDKQAQLDTPNQEYYAAAIEEINGVQEERDNVFRLCMKGDCGPAQMMAEIRARAGITPPFRKPSLCGFPEISVLEWAGHIDTHSS